MGGFVISSLIIVVTGRGNLFRLKKEHGAMQGGALFGKGDFLGDGALFGRGFIMFYNKSIFK